MIALAVITTWFHRSTSSPSTCARMCFADSGVRFRAFPHLEELPGGRVGDDWGAQAENRKDEGGSDCASAHGDDGG
jgi:hypothetical protein